MLGQEEEDAIVDPPNKRAIVGSPRGEANNSMLSAWFKYGMLLLARSMLLLALAQAAFERFRSNPTYLVPESLGKACHMPCCCKDVSSGKKFVLKSRSKTWEKALK